MNPINKGRSWKEYLRLFSEPCEFWTSEDGSLLSLVILPSDNAPELLKAHHAFQNEPFDPTRIKSRHAVKEWVGQEFFDGRSGRQKGKIWRVTDEITEFPVLEYELASPR